MKFYIYSILLFTCLTSSALAQGIPNPGPINIVDYGGDPTGTNDSSSALINACAAAARSPTGNVINFSAGRFKFLSSVTCAYPARKFYANTFVGAGSGTTVLYWPNTDGLAVNAQLASQSVHIRDLSFTTGSTGHNGLILTNTAYEGIVEQSDVFRVTFAGDDGGAQSDWWGVGVTIKNWSDVNFDSSTFYGDSTGKFGAGIYVFSNGSGVSQLGFFYNVAKSAFFNLGVGIQIGSQIQGVTVLASQFVNGATCILVPSGGTNLSLLAITDSQFNCLSQSQVVIQSPVASIIMKGNVLYIPANNAGVFLNASGQEHIFVGNVFTCLVSVGSCGGTTGIFVNANNTNSTISANVFTNLQTAVQLAGAPRGNWTVSQNSYGAVAVKVNNPGGAGNNIGINTP